MEWLILNRGAENAFILIGREARLYGYKRHREERDLVGRDEELFIWLLFISAVKYPAQ